MSLRIEFRKSGKTVQWEERFESLLELARENGIEIETECEQGICGACRTKLLSGEVEMEIEDGLDDEARDKNMILMCVAIPKTDIVLEA
ncbi:MAG: 2Fe-2S iron-sulfur cluster binding domain-containing protein [Deltaproteobacteria bacterium]|jgi:ferredoxin